MQQIVKVTRLLEPGYAEVFLTRQSACSGDCGSCGGCGAAKLGLRLPERYAAVASLSGALEMENDYHMRKMRDSDRLYQELLNIFGTEEEFLASDNCLTRLAEQLDPAKAPRMYVACGTADFSLAAAETARSVTAIDLDDCRLSPATG